jgi:fructose-1,6-bisphosphatase I
MFFYEYLDKKAVEKGLGGILTDIMEAATRVSEKMKISHEGHAGTENIHGEKQLKLDIFANEVFVDVLRKNKAVGLMASEELDESIENPEVESNDGYSVAFDPLDGSSLVDVNLAVGSIFSVYKGKGFLGRKGSEQVAAMIVVYGPRLSFLVSVGRGVDEFIFDVEAREFLLSHEQLKLSVQAKMFAPGNLRACSSEAWYLELLNYWVKNGYTLRYSGGMVPDVNQILRKGGGVFTYPGYKEQPLGKLRLLYECAPMAFLVEQAGGKAVSDHGRILDIEIKDLHQKMPIFLGSKNEVDLVEKFRISKDF